MNRLLTTLPVALAAVLAASTASAGAIAGTYSGTSTDGNTVSFTVAVDGNGVLALTGETIYFSALCNDGSTLNTGWGLGYDQPITTARVKGGFAFNYLTTSFNLLFSSDGQSAAGRVATVSPTLTPVGPTPKRALFCRSKSQAVTLTRQPGPVRVVPPTQGAVYLGKLAHSAF